MKRDWRGGGGQCRQSPTPPPPPRHPPITTEGERVRASEEDARQVRRGERRNGCERQAVASRVFASLAAQSAIVSVGASLRYVVENDRIRSTPSATRAISRLVLLVGATA